MSEVEVFVNESISVVLRQTEFPRCTAHGRRIAEYVAVRADGVLIPIGNPPVVHLPVFVEQKGDAISVTEMCRAFRAFE